MFVNNKKPTILLHLIYTVIQECAKKVIKFNQQQQKLNEKKKTIQRHIM